MNIELTHDDLLWIGAKIVSDYESIKHDSSISKEKRSEKIGFLVDRAKRFELNEILFKIGYSIMDIPLGMNGRKATIIYPTEQKLEALQETVKLLEKLQA